MVVSKVFLVSVTALLATCGTCFQDAAALHRIDEGSSGGRGLLRRKKNDQEVVLADGEFDTGDVTLERTLLSIEGASSTRDLLRKRGKKGKKGRRGGNSNNVGVFISQPTNPNIQGDGNTVVGGSVGNVFNPNAGTGRNPRNPRRPRNQGNTNNGGVFISQPTNPNIIGDGNQVFGGGVGDIFNGRKLKSIEGTSPSRDLLRNFNRAARDRIFNSNNGGVFVSQPTNPNIQGDGNTVVGGSVGNIGGKRKLSSIEGISSTRDLLRKRGKKGKKGRRGGNSNNGGVFINQPTNPNIRGNRNQVTGGSVGNIFNANTGSGRNPRNQGRRGGNSNNGGVFISQPTNPTIRGNGNQVIGGGVGDIFNGRKLKTIEGTYTRGLLGSEKKADSQAVNVNKDGVLISTQTTANIEGDNNKVIGDTGPIKVDSDDDAVVIKGKAISIVEDTPDGENPKGDEVLTATSDATNINDGGVLISQQTTANIKGDGNVVEGGVTGDIFIDK